MIQVIYYRSYNRVTIEGHALSGEPGHDLICAGVSALAYTLAVNVQNMASSGYVRQPAAKLDQGKAEISCTPLNRYRATVRLVLDSICAGLELLAKKYPANISFEIRG